jgi:hypothetical protein
MTQSQDIPAGVVAACQGWIIRGATDEMIRQALREKAPGIDPDAAILEAMDRLRDQGVLDSKYTRGWAATAYRALINKMLEIGDLDGARKAISNIVKLAEAQPTDTKGQSELDRLLEWGDQHGTEKN